MRAQIRAASFLPQVTYASSRVPSTRLFQTEAQRNKGMEGGAKWAAKNVRLGQSRKLSSMPA